MKAKRSKLFLLTVIGAGAFITVWQGCSPSGFIASTNELALSSSSQQFPPGDKACTTSAVGEAPMQRLTKIEYNNVIRDLFGLNKDYSADFSRNGEGGAGFTTEGEAQNLSLSIVTDYWKASQAVSDDIFAKNPNPILSCTSGNDCARTIITNVAKRAFRRPANSDEIEKLFAVYSGAKGATFNDKLKVAVRAILVSPQFIYRLYQTPASGEMVTALTDYELASRLSFFIWGSIPDAALMADADSGNLKDRAVLVGHMKRMLADPRVSYISRSFGYDWLKLAKLDEKNLDTARFPTWNPDLRQSMKNETVNFLDSVIVGDQSVMELVSGNYSFLDQRMSRHYGVNGSSSDQFVRVELGENRSGILTHPSILTLTSTAQRTSPVVRGKFLLEQILCSGTGGPPADIPIINTAPNGQAFTESQIRQRLAVHAAQGAACTACHLSLDPIGLAYENFDASGAFRTKYPDNVAVDASGQLPTGEKLQDFRDLAKVVQTDPRFRACFTEKLASYANGRNMNSNAAKCMTRSIASKSVGPGKKFSDVVQAIVEHETFRVRKVKY